MNYKILITWLSLGFVLQIVSFSCYCPEYYEVYSLDKNPSIKFLEYDSSEYNNWIDVQEGSNNDSLKVLFLCPLNWTDTGSLSLLAPINTCYASSPCDPLDYVLIDTIADLRIFTLDTFGNYLPHEEIININGWNSDIKKEVIDEFNYQMGFDFKGLQVEFALDPLIHKGYLSFSIEVELVNGRIIKGSSKEFFWR